MQLLIFSIFGPPIGFMLWLLVALAAGTFKGRWSGLLADFFSFLHVALVIAYMFGWLSAFVAGVVDWCARRFPPIRRLIITALTGFVASGLVVNAQLWSAGWHGDNFGRLHDFVQGMIVVGPFGAAAAAACSLLTNVVMRWRIPRRPVE